MTPCTKFHFVNNFNSISTIGLVFRCNLKQTMPYIFFLIKTVCCVRNCYSPKVNKSWTYLKFNRKYLFHLYSPHSYLLQFTMGHMLPIINAKA